jgi:hypothetical protein
MGRRLELQGILENILGSRNVYFQPPSNTKIQYPCIVYQRNNIDGVYADNSKYLNKYRYSLTLIGSSPENSLIESLLELPYCSYDRFYVADGLNHDSFTLYY